jgi:hypothetical protein
MWNYQEHFLDIVWRGGQHNFFFKVHGVNI